MRKIVGVLALFGYCAVGFGQTNTILSGNWNNAAIWTAGTPTGTSTANVNHPLIINTNVTVGTGGNFTFNANATDLSGGSAFTFTTGGTNPSPSIVGIYGTVTFEGAGTIGGFTNLTIYPGGTLIMGATAFANNINVDVQAGGTLIINGNLTNNNNGGTFVVAGTVQVNGSYSTTGSTTLSGSGSFTTTGPMTTTGGSTIFGSPNDCGAGPCSGNNLCGFANSISADQLICSGGSVTTLSGPTTGAVSPTFTWEQSTTSSTSGFTTIVGATSATYTPSGLTQTTWFRRLVTAGGCTGTSTAVRITVVSSGGWSGITSTNWHTASNWCSGVVPDANTDVTINPGAPNMPVISAAATARNLTLAAGATLTISGSNTLDLKGNVTISGTFNVNTSTVLLTGTSQQSVSGNNTIFFNNLTINNTAAAVPQVTFNSFPSIYSTLTMTAGIVNLNNNTLTIGTAAGTPGALSYTAGRLYNGTILRWIGTGAIADGAAAGHFPIGSVSDYRPIFLSTTANPTTGGQVFVAHIPATTTATVSFADGASTVIARQDSYWPISTQTLAGGTYVLRAEGTGFGSVTDVNHLRLVRVASVVGTAGTNGGTVANPIVRRTALSLAQLTNNFYMGSVNILSPLPITLTNFRGVATPEGTLLSWATLTEENFDHFQVERSASGVDFTAIGNVMGAGNSNSKRDYNFTDGSAWSGRMYYRLKNIDRDGAFEYSEVIAVEKTSSAVSYLYPNPVTNRVMNIDFSAPESGGRSVIVYSTTGQVLKRMELGELRNEIQLDDSLTPGMYLVRVISGTSTQLFKVVVQ